MTKVVENHPKYGRVTWVRASIGTLGTGLEATRVEGPERYLMRNSEHPDVVLEFTPEEWKAFLAGLHNWEFLTAEHLEVLTKLGIELQSGPGIALLQPHQEAPTE